ncbi:MULTISPECIES: hypothetical protein [unclassified Streptomyces]|uniref:hypothetical protein n=1 Tax=unclassified Streptomyces TaxID=2593676 RepID=UPI00093F3CD7|nr:hypothetical protein [Streptomyces sp. TSRI0281]OKI38253.1 hypothetical protein A6A29_09730 [Streptomyces sp. TSRI0281]
MNTGEPYGSDELMAVLLGEPAPRDGGSGTAARYAAAERDLAVLGTQLRLIGDALAAAPEPAAPGPPARRSRWRVLALAASLVGAAALAGTGIMWSVARPSDGRHGDAKPTHEGIMACARLVVDGTVNRTERVAPGLRVVLDVERRLKPERGPRQAVFLVPGKDADHYPPGARMVVRVSRFPGEGVDSYTAAADRAAAWEWMSAALPGSRDVECSGPG